MGSSIFLIILIPLLLLYGVFGRVSEKIFGSPESEIVLPYDPAKGVVWEYDNVDDFYIDLVRTEIDGSKQIFVFTNGDCDTDTEGGLMDLIFTDKNGNQVKYYADNGDYFHAPTYYKAEECMTIEYTAVASEPEDFPSWAVSTNANSVLVKKASEIEGREETFTVVATPEAIESGSFFVGFDYEYRNDSDEKNYEYLSVKFGITDDGLTVISESRMDAYVTMEEIEAGNR